MAPPIVVTGAAGFIGMHTCSRLLSDGATVVGIDNLNDYYDPALKEARIQELSTEAGFRFQRQDLCEPGAFTALMARERPTQVVHLAAQPGIRHSVNHPHAYVQSNIVGFLNVLEACRLHPVDHLVYASSSSVYGADATLPFRAEEPSVHSLNVYAATKLSGELLAHAYANLHRLPTTGLRFFTVYGPWGRPDMALFSFTRAILAGESIPVFNHGDMARDFTYVDDIVEGMIRILGRPPAETPPFRVANIGRGEPVRLLDMIEALGRALGREPVLDLQPMQPGEAPRTHADVSTLEREVGYRPETSLEEGIGRFVQWYLARYTEGR